MPTIERVIPLLTYGARDLEGHRWWFSAPVKGPSDARR